MDGTEWQFCLAGGGQDIRWLTEKQRTIYFDVTGGVDHWRDCMNDDFRMTSIFCKDEDDIGVVSQIGHELVSLFNGAACIINKSYRKIKVEEICYDDSFHSCGHIENPMAMFGRPDISNEQFNLEYQKAYSADLRIALLMLATEREDIYLLLKCFDMKGDWITYYKILETIESFCTKNNIAIDINKKDRQKFTSTANNFSLSGLDSRHGFKQVVKENKTGAMSIEEAYTFVLKLAKDYINMVTRQLSIAA